MRPYKSAVSGCGARQLDSFYVGINAGAGMADSAISDPDCATCSNIRFQTAFATAGGQVGYNWQWRAMVLGLEGDLNWTSARATDAFALCCSSNRIGSEAHSKFDAFASIRGRMGMAFDNALIYVTGGPVWGHFNSGVSNLDLPFTNNASTDDGWHPGLAIGTGAEFVLANNWTLRGEYLFLNFRHIDRHLVDSAGYQTCGDVNCRVNYAYSAHIARLGINIGSATETEPMHARSSTRG